MAFLFVLPKVVLHFFLFVDQRYSEPILQKSKFADPIQINILTRRVCVEENTMCQLMDKEGLLKRAFLVYHDA